MAKIAILTQPLQSNYGGILQAYALQKKLEYLGYDPVTIDRQYNSVNPAKIILSDLKNNILNLFNTDKRRFTRLDRNIITKNTKKFVNHNIKISEKIDSDKKLIKHFKKNKYDGIIVGSDQVWRPKYSPNIYNFYLDFLPNDYLAKKVTYAASFGVDKWEYNDNQRLLIKNLIRKFDAISVREKSGIEICDNYLDVNSELVLDPTFLLSKEDYISLLNLNKVTENRNIFYYQLDSSDLFNEVINNVQTKLNFSITTNQPKCFQNKPKSFNIKDYVYPPIESWVSSFLNSNFIVTDSFHGVVFSIIFNKPFIVVANNERGLARFKSILSLTGLENRLVKSVEDITEDIYQPINYEYVNLKVEKLKKISIRFLKNNLGSL